MDDAVFSDDDENGCFFDAVEDTEVVDCAVENWGYDLWIKPLQSVNERRMEFIRLMGFASVTMKEEEEEEEEEEEGEVSRECSNCGTVTCSEDESLSSSGPKNVEAPVGETINHRSPKADVEICRRKDQFFRDKFLHRWRSVTSSVINKLKNRSDPFDPVEKMPVKRIRARHHRKRLKELSALFAGQDIRAHDGPISTVRFSHDGKFLATAGDDKLVKVWRVMEGERSNLVDIPADADPSCTYFTMNRLSELKPLEKDDPQKIIRRSLRKSMDSACVIFPQKVFRILEEPVRIFRGHGGAILDLSWSQNNCLLSSSVDKTVRLWKLGVDHCIKIFSHTDYVTCIQFNPVNDDYFVSGSIDGKVRIWSINGCQVVSWTETKEIITAVSYSPDGEGGVFGSFSGSCQFFSVGDNRLQFESEVCLTSKRKLPSTKRITGFQFLPDDPQKVLVSCADSQIRIIDRSNVVAKYKGLRNSGCCLSASFTRNGKHIVSASEDSNVCLWNYDARRGTTVRSLEFLPCEAPSIAVPWPGMDRSSFEIVPVVGPGFFSSSAAAAATWPEEKLPPIAENVKRNSSRLGKSEYRLFKASCQNSSSGTHACGLVFVTAGSDGRIRSFHNYGLPIPL